MKKHNVLVQVAVAGALLAMFGSANAQSSMTLAAAAPKFAVEVFKGNSPAAPVPLSNTTIVSGTAIPAGSTVTVLVQLAAGNFFNTLAAPTVAPAAGVGGTAAVTLLNSAGAAVVASTATTASNADVALVTLTGTTGGVGLGGSLLTIGGATPITVHAAGLATVGATVTATSTVYTGALAAMPAAGTAALDATSAATTVATSAQGITLAAAATAAGTQKIDLTATPVGSKLNVAPLTVANLGTVTATNGTAVNAAGAAYAIGAKTLTATITAPAGFFAPMAATKQIWLEAAGCTAVGAALAGTPSTLFATAAAAAAATTVTLGAATPVSATAYHVCMEVDGTTAMKEGTASVALSLGAAAAQDSADTLAATPLMALAYNGQQVDVRNYVPAANVGWTQYLRIINTGAVAAPVSAAVINETTGAVGAAVVLVPSLAAGAATSLSATQIEAAIGAQAIAARPRIRISAPTNGLEVQNILFTPNGSFTAMQGKE